jgi:hypothetical protein
MARFFFDIDTEPQDQDGVDLPNRYAARSEAIRAAAEALRDIDGALSTNKWVMHVRDEHNRSVLEITFSVTEGVG